MLGPEAKEQVHMFLTAREHKMPLCFPFSSCMLYPDTDVNTL